MIFGLGLSPTLTDQLTAEGHLVAACGSEGVPKPLKRCSTSGVPPHQGIIDRAFAHGSMVVARRTADHAGHYGRASCSRCSKPCGDC